MSESDPGAEPPRANPAPKPNPAAGQTRMPVIDMRFLKRTAASTAVVIVTVALFAFVKFNRAWAGYYLLFGFWSLGFFSLTALMIKAMLLDRRPRMGIFFVGLKLAMMIAAAAFLMIAAPTAAGGESGNIEATGVVAGTLTPFLTLILRVFGAMLGPGKSPIEAARETGRQAKLGPAPGRFPRNDSSAPGGPDKPSRHESET